jgi:enoyl-CoA hydratase/carnithine racemase
MNQNVAMEPGASDLIRTDVADGILCIQLDRPEKKNALTAAMYAGLASALEHAAADPAVRVVVIHGHPQVFTAGNDLADFMTSPPAGEDAPVLRFLRAISAAPLPIVAAVDGPAVGVGTTLLLHCDLVYAGEGARFQLPFVNLALVPEAGSTLLLPATAGYRRAAELLLLGEPFSAAQAQQYGIVSEVVADGETVAAAMRAARKLAAKPPAAVRLTKQLMKQPAADAVAQQIQAEARHFEAQLRSPEAAEAFKAFLRRDK